MVFDDGNWHQELIADWIRKSAYALHSEQMKIETPVGPGHIDGILTDLLQIDRLLEIKSVNHFSYERWWKGQYPLDYFTQVGLYLHGLHAIQPDITEAILLCKNKNTSSLMEFHLAYNQDEDLLVLTQIVRSDGQRTEPNFTMEGVCTDAVQKFAAVRIHVLDKTLPDRPYPVGTDYPCGYCAWAETCWEGYEDEFDLLTQDAQLDEEIATTCGYLKEVQMHKGEMEKEEKRLKEIVREYMVSHDYRSGKAGEYVITREMRHSTSWDESAMSLETILAAKQIKPYEILTIRKPRQKGVKDASRAAD